MSEIESGVKQHYTRAGLTQRIIAAFEEGGLDPQALTYSDLAALDQFHTRGRDATVDLAKLAEVRAGFKILYFEQDAEEALTWFQNRATDGPRRISLQLVMGPEFATMVANQIRNLAEGRAGMLRGVRESVRSRRQACSFFSDRATDWRMIRPNLCAEDRLPVRRFWERAFPLMLAKPRCQRVLYETRQAAKLTAQYAGRGPLRKNDRCHDRRLGFLPHGIFVPRKVRSGGDLRFH